MVEDRRIQVLTRNHMTSFAQSFTIKNGQNPTNLDDLTNQVFEDLLQNKNPESMKLPSDQGSLKVNKYIKFLSNFFFCHFYNYNYHEVNMKHIIICYIFAYILYIYIYLYYFFYYIFYIYIYILLCFILK
jgi:hypothetical protein